MAFELELPPLLSAQGWKVKIRDKERMEPPHVSILRKTDCWRYDLRTGGFLDDDPPPRKVPTQLMELVTTNLDLLRTTWDAMYPENPIGDLRQ